MTKNQRVAELKCQSYFGEHCHKECQNCQYHQDGDDSEEEEFGWCLLAHGIYQEENCHLCPGISTN